MQNRKSIKANFIISLRIIISYHNISHFRERENRRNTERPLRSNEDKDWRDSQNHWDIMACFHSISSFLLVRLPWQRVARLFLLGLNVINSISMYSLWLWCCLILIILWCWGYSCFPLQSYEFELLLKNAFWI